MSLNKPLVLVILGVAAVLGTGGALIIWPNYSRVARMAARIADLQYKAANSEVQTTAVKRLTDEVETARAYVRKELKTLPDSPDVAELIGVLSVPVDGRTVKDRQFTKGKPVEAVQGGPATTLAMPLTVEMKATFSSVFRLLQMVESMDRLVRVTSVRLTTEKTAEPQPTPFLTATIGLEAIYEGSPAGAGDSHSPVPPRRPAREHSPEESH